MFEDLLRMEPPIKASEVAIVVAHPDDEAVAFCAVLCAYPSAYVVHVTDGAPHDPREWKGEKTAGDYAKLRASEARAALSAIDFCGLHERFDVSDSRALWNAGPIASMLGKRFSALGIRAVFTHAFEGGHPDHDAIACAVRHAASQLDIVILEAPFYRAPEIEKGQSIWQSFVAHPEHVEHVVTLTGDVRAKKIRMLEAYKSQAAACERVSLEHERLRRAPAYDFSRLPPRLSRHYAQAGIHQTTWSYCLEGLC